MDSNLDLELTMRRYLLGDISETEQAELEAKYFADDRQYELLSIVEQELIDEYVRGKLSPDDKLQFETRYLTSPDRQSRVDFAGALARIATEQHTTSKSMFKVATKALLERIVDMVRTPRPGFEPIPDPVTPLTPKHVQSQRTIQGRIIAVSGNNVTLDMGSESGLRVGEHLNVYQVFDNQGGTAPTEIGVVIISAVWPQKSVGRFSGSPPAMIGYLVSLGRG